MRPAPLRRLSTILLPALALLALATVAALLWLPAADFIQAQDGQAQDDQPRITAGPTITSSPAGRDTYGKGETIVVAVTFSETVSVSGQPRVRLIMGERQRWARYSSGDGATLTFAYTVRGNDRDADGVSIGKNALKLRGGTIADGDGNAANLKHPALSDQAGHKVNGSQKATPAEGEQQQQEPANSPPAFASENVTLSVDENAGVGASVGDAITATDADGDALTYALTGSGAFAINGSSGQITVRGALDYETTASYSVTVTVSDGRNAAGEADDSVDDSIMVAISVTNVDEPGVVSIESAAGTAQAGSNLRAILLDPDGEVTGLSWTWERSSDGENWETSRAGHRRSGAPGSGSGGGGGGGRGGAGASGDTYVPPGRDVGNYLRARASYADGQGPGKTARSAATSAVMAEPPPSGQPHVDGNDHATSVSGYGLTISPAAIKDTDFTGKTTVVTLTPTSPDPDATFPLKFAGDGTGGRRIFDLSSASAACIATAKGLAQFSLVGAPSGLAITDVRYPTVAGALGPACVGNFAKMTLTLSSALTQPSYTVTLTVEHEALSLWDSYGSCSLFWNAYDPTLCPESISATFTLTATDRVSPTISTLAITSSPPAGQNDTYKTGDKIVATATFSEAITVTGTPQLVINVGGADKTARCAVKSDDASKLECSYTVATNDADGDGVAVEAGKLTGTIKDTAKNAAVLTYTALPTQSKHKVDGVKPAIAFPLGETPAESSASTITLTDAGAKVRKYGAIVVDGGAGAASDCDTAAKVGDDNLTALAAPVASQDFGYTPPAGSAGKKVCAYAEDAAGNSHSRLWASAIVAINKPPALSGADGGLHVVLYGENGAGPVATYTAVDPESDRVIWTLTGTDASRFNISDAGVLTFKTPPDRENPTDAGKNNVYNLTVNVSDGKATNAAAQSDDGSGAYDLSIDASIDVAVVVLNVNEPPILSGGSNVEGFPENEIGPVATYAALDPESDELTWTLTGQDASRFTLDDSGDLTFKSPPDYENPTDAGADNVYNLTVNVSDGKGVSGFPDAAIDNSITLTVTVADVEERLFIKGPSSVHFLIINPGTRALGRYSVADASGDGLSWTLTGSDASLFSISNGGVLSFKETPNLEDPADQGKDNVYNVTVNVADGKGGSGSRNVTVKIVPGS